MEITERLKAYPPEFLKFGYYLDGKVEVLNFYKFQEKFFHYLDLNYYFFANHPNSRVGITETEKFPFFLLPFFIYGLYKIFIQKNYVFYILLIISIIYLSLFFDEVTNPVIIYPFIIYAIFKGITKK